MADRTLKREAEDNDMLIMLSLTDSSKSIGAFAAGYCPDDNEDNEGDPFDSGPVNPEKEPDLYPPDPNPNHTWVHLKHSLERGCSLVGVSILPQGSSETMRGQGLNLHQGRFWWDIRRNFFTERVIQHWNGLPEDVVESQSLESGSGGSQCQVPVDQVGIGPRESGEEVSRNAADKTLQVCYTPEDAAENIQDNLLYLILASLLEDLHKSLQSTTIQ
ncbi:hypothetical protein DUI87_13308 [Hirundo rustica rustica]|uniref:Uncharacterized protein n=1 Tax=Hirundo rustica rustica TaxID=333673 RepID=A0A3M0KBC2_HIRRU|nr:hypothetical protein DUI87_13308 [Hirundo rustica rustica]